MKSETTIEKERQINNIYTHSGYSQGSSEKWSPTEKKQKQKQFGKTQNFSTFQKNQSYRSSFYSQKNQTLNTIFQKKQIWNRKRNPQFDKSQQTIKSISKEIKNFNFQMKRRRISKRESIKTSELAKIFEKLIVEIVNQNTSNSKLFLKPLLAVMSCYSGSIQKLKSYIDY